MLIEGSLSGLKPTRCAGPPERSFVGNKKRPRWLWWVEDAINGEVVAFVFGRRTHATFRRLLSVLKAAQIQVSGWITDAWCRAAGAGLL